MLTLIKEAQQQHDSVQLVLENCAQMSVTPVLLESLSGILHTYIQQINSGKLKTFDYNNVSALANIFAFSTMLGALDAPSVDDSGANAIINLYKQVQPADPNGAATQIINVVDRLSNDKQAQFRQLANAWGKTLSNIMRQSTPEALKRVSNYLLRLTYKVEPVVQQLQNGHGDSIMKKKVRSGVLSRQLGV